MRRESQNSFNRTFYVVEYNQELNFIDTHWDGYASPTDLRNAMDVGLEMLEQTHCAYKLNDNTQCTGPWEDAVKWLEKEWLPRAMEAGLSYLAHVAHPNSFGEASGKAMEVSLIGRKLVYKMFTTRPEALAWLKECQSKSILLAQ